MLLLRVQTLLQCARRGELRCLAGGDVDRLAGGRVASLASSPVTDAELAEACQRDLTPSGQLVRYRLDRCLQGLAGMARGQSRLPRDLVSQIVLGHWHSLLGFVTDRRLTAGEDDEERNCPIWTR